MKKLLSVIVPVYNVEKYLRKCIESVLAQDYSRIEIILVDDGSTDSCSDICDEYERENVVVIHQSNKGLSVARNVGLELAQGEYIAFLDSDDFIEPNMYSILIDLIEKYQMDISACATVNFYEDGRERSSLGYDDSIKIILSHEMLGDLYCNQNARAEVWNKVYRREIIEGVMFKAGQKFEDLYFDRIVFQRSNGCAFINKPLHHYLVARPGNTNSSFDSNKLCAFDELEAIKGELINDGYQDDADKILAMQLFFSMLLGCQCYEHNGKIDDREYLEKKFKQYKKDNKRNPYAKRIRSRIVLYSISPALLSIVLRIKSLIFDMARY